MAAYSLEKIFFVVLLSVVVFSGAAQQLSFSRPYPVLPQAHSDQSPSIVNFSGHYYIAWKDAASRQIWYCSLGRRYDSALAAAPTMLANAYSENAPLLRVLGERLFLFWITESGQLGYTQFASPGALQPSDIHELNFSGRTISRGISATAIDNRFVLSSHGKGSNELVYAFLSPDSSGLIPNPILLPIPHGRSSNAPFVVGVDEKTIRCHWQEKSGQLVFADLNPYPNTWARPVTVSGVRTQSTPVAYHVWNTSRLFYLWKDQRDNGKLFYASTAGGQAPGAGTALPHEFTSDYPGSICKVDDNNFLLAQTGSGGRLYLSNFSSYDPASWMEDVFKTASSEKTLRDIVIPGSHDAGMSKLSATGGQQRGTINECNILTQNIPIAQQLNQGIRMFDLRIGSFGNEFYTKHASSDCMEEAIGGGYGEKLRDVMAALRAFLQKNKQEIILVSFSHFCEKETPIAKLKDSLLLGIGREFIFEKNAAFIGDVPLKQLAGKLVLSVEMESREPFFPSCTIGESSKAFINFKRAYAATPDVKKLLESQSNFFRSIENGVVTNDLVRIDWQLTQSAEEASMVCNDFQDENLHPLVNGLLSLTNVIAGNKSILARATEGNKYLFGAMDQWIDEGILNGKTKPNIIYVDVAGSWITDYCIDLNRSLLYR